MGAAIVVALSTTVRAQGDEIQVYDGGLAPRGVFNLTWHNNYVAKGLRGQAFPGAVAADGSFNGVPEWAYGVNRWFEAGLYMPLYSNDQTLGFGLDGFKVRFLFAVPDADERTFVYGINFETSYNAKRWDTRRITQEARPIIGWHLKPFDLFFNPIMDSRFEGGIRSLEFAPSARLAYNISKTTAIAAEQYADLGEFRNLQSVNRQGQQLFAVVDHSTTAFDFEAGVGFGLTNESDKLTFKLILSRDLNARK
jgi:hypothetical protein